MTVEEHRTLAHTAQLAGSICAVLALALGLLSTVRLAGGQWEALAGLAAAAWLLHTANVSFRDADIHHSHAAALKETLS